VVDVPVLMARHSGFMLAIAVQRTVHEGDAARGQGHDRGPMIVERGFGRREWQHVIAQQLGPHQ
jgi:hypothetical protein